MKSIHEIRRENLKEILRRYFDGKQIRLAERLEIQQNLVSRWESGAKNIGDKVARRIEEAARVESHWLDVDHQLANMLENQESDTGPTNTSELAASILKKWMDADGLSQQKVAAAPASVRPQLTACCETRAASPSIIWQRLQSRSGARRMK